MSKARFSIPTVYNNTQMRSRLEADIAFALDKLKIRWEYEKTSFLLSSGTHYYVDFYLPDLKTWLEGKGVPRVSEEALAKQFVKENNSELILLSRRRGLWFSAIDSMNILRGQDLYVGKCSHCGSFFFCGLDGSFFCRKCRAHEGDHDILAYGIKIFDKKWLRDPYKTVGRALGDELVGET